MALRMLQRRPAGEGVAALYPLLFVVGLTSTAGQLVLMRELVATFFGNELVLGLILAAWLAWVAVGAWAIGPRLRRSGMRAMVLGLVLSAILLMAQVLFVRASRSLMGVTPGALVGLVPLTLTTVLILAPLCLLVGVQFTLGARLVAEREGKVGGAYVAESLGAVTGGALFTFVLVRILDPVQIVLVVGVLNLALAAHLGLGLRWTASLGGLLLLVVAMPMGGWLNRSTLSWQYDHLRFARDSVYGRTVVTGSGEQRAFFENGLLFFETQGVASEEVAHLPLLAHPAPRRVLLVGGGVDGTLAHVLQHPQVAAVDYVELDPMVVTAARSELPPDQAAALDDPRVTVVHTDGRLYVRAPRAVRVRSAGEAVTGTRTPPVEPVFDVIILALPEPATGQLNRFYTQEFFAEVHARLAEEGVFALGLPWQENYPSEAHQRLAASVYRTLGVEFPEIALLPSERLYLLASDRPLPEGATVLIERLENRGIEARWVVPSFLDYLLTTDRVAQARLLLEASGETRLNRDLAPICYYYDLLVWLSLSDQGLVRIASGASLLSVGWAALPLVLIVLIVRLHRPARRRRWAIPAAIGLIGLAQMMLEVALLFGFQVVHGQVYGQVGLIVTAFMAGLALGSFVANRWSWPHGATPDPSRGDDGIGQRISPRHSPRAMLAWIQGTIVLVALALPVIISVSPPAWVFGLYALAGGGLTGLAFPVAVACEQPVSGRGGKIAGALYGADLAGGCLGALAASALLLPVLGIPQTCVVVALAGAAGVAIVV